MAVVLRFTADGFTSAQYDETVKRLEAAGQGSPAGRLYHVCFGDTNNLRVSDIWDSTESFERFEQTLKPIMEDLGIEGGNIEFLQVYNTIEGTRADAATT